MSETHAIFQQHISWAKRHAEPLKRFIQPHANSKAPDRALRVGYVSADFKQHAVSYFLEPILAAHDRSAFHITCYSDVKVPDAVTQRLSQYPAEWRNTAQASDEQLAQFIRQDAIDILVDLAGHTAGNRLLVFARKPAPLQITYLGYPTTTGLDTMDYRITDAHADPPGKTEQLHSEKLLRLPRTAWCYQPDPQAPAVAPPPVLNNGLITFGSFNNFAKVTNDVLDLWAQVLQALPNSRILLKARGLHQPRIQSRLREHFAKGGIAADRLILHPGTTSYTDHLAMYGAVDVALDTFPYNGTTTTLEALHMGVPVVTLEGAVHAARVGVSLLCNVGLPALIAHSRQEYSSLTRFAFSRILFRNPRRHLPYISTEARPIGPRSKLVPAMR